MHHCTHVHRLSHWLVFIANSLLGLVAFHLLTHTRVQTEINLQISVLLQNATDARWNSTLGQCDVLKSPYMLLLH